MKSKICLLLVLICTVSAVCAANAETADQKSFSLFVGAQSTTLNKSNDDVMAWQKAQEVTGIDVEFVHGDSDALTLLIASNELPDAISIDWSGFSGGPQSALDNEVIIPLTEEMLTTYAPHYWAYLQAWPEVAKMVVTDEGVHYQIAGIVTWEMDESKGFTSVVDRPPHYESWMGLILRKDLLDQTGLNVPVTIDDWTTVLRAFKEMGVASPLAAPIGNFKQCNVFAGAFGVGTGLYQDENRKAHFGPMEDEYKDYLALMNSWYAEGLLDADLAALDGNAVKAKFVSGETGLMIGTGGWLGSTYDTAHAQDPNSSFYAIPVANPVLNEGDEAPKYGMKSAIYKQGVAITPQCKDPSVVLSFYDYLWTDEGIITANWGIEGQSYKINEAGLPEFNTAALENNEWGYSASEMMMKVYMLNEAIPIDMRNRLFQMTLYGTQEAVGARQTWSNSLLAASMPPYVVPSEDASDYATIGNDVKTYVDEMYVKFIMGLEPLDNFDSFRDQLRKMGVEQYISIAQAALDIYNAR